jgi:hypothetical protein
LGLPVNEVRTWELPEDVVSLVEQVLSDHAGQVVLIAGHAHTIPAIVEELGEDRVGIIPNEEFDNLFVVTVQGTRPAEVLHLKYGYLEKLGGNGR